jgi:hypothetical protein
MRRLIWLVPLAVGVATAQTPEPIVSINCAGGVCTAADGTNWKADQYYSGGDLQYTGSRINGMPASSIDCFSATQTSITAGQSVTLFWRTANSGRSIDQGIGNVPASGLVNG